MTHLDLWHEGGPVFWVIVFTGLASVAVFLERLLHLRRARIHYADFLEGVFNILAKGNVREAQALCDEAPGPVAHLMRMAITNRDEPREVLRQVLDNAGHAEISRMERRLGVLATIVQIAPLLGLLGSLFVSYNSLPMALLGAVTGFVFFFVLYWVGSRLLGAGALGFGDVTLATMIGAMTGFPLVLLALVLGILLGGLITALLLLTRRLTMRSYLAYGPFLAVAGIVAVVWAEGLLGWYLR